MKTWQERARINGLRAMELQDERDHLRSLLQECQTVLEFYAGNYDGNDGSGWVGNTFQSGSLVGTREQDPTTKAREMLAKLKKMKYVRPVLNLWGEMR